MSRRGEMMEILAPIFRSLLPTKTWRSYDSKIPFTLWGSLHPDALDGRRLEQRVKTYLTFLARADHLNYPMASDLVERLLRAPYTEFSAQHANGKYWTMAFKHAAEPAQFPKRSDYIYNRFAEKMRDIELLVYILGHVSGTSTAVATYYNMVLDDTNSHTWEKARMASAVSTYLALQDWWQTEGLRFKRAYPNDAAYKRQVKPKVRFYLVDEVSPGRT